MNLCSKHVLGVDLHSIFSSYATRQNHGQSLQSTSKCLSAKLLYFISLGIGLRNKAVHRVGLSPGHWKREIGHNQFSDTLKLLILFYFAVFSTLS